MTYRSRPVMILMVVLLMSVLAGSASAQGRTEAGLRGGYHFTLKKLGLGGQLRIPVAPAIELIPSGDFWFSGATDGAVNLDIAASTGSAGAVYGGGGVALVFSEPNGDSQSDIGANLFVGVAPYRSGVSGLRWFLEGRYLIRSGTNPFVLVIGLNAPLGG